MNHPVIRQLADTDRWRLRPHFKALNSADRHLRFGATLNDSAVDRYVDLIDFDSDAVFGVAGEDGDLIAVAHVAPVGEGAELGLSVHEAARSKGLGDALFGQAVAWARNRFLQRIFMHCLRENRAILHLARKHGMSVSMDGPDSSAVMVLPVPTFETWFSEQAAHWRAAADDLMRMENPWLELVMSAPQTVAAAFAPALPVTRSGH